MDIGFDNQVFGLQSRGGISRYFAELGGAMQSLGERVYCAAGLHFNDYLRTPGFHVAGVHVGRYPRALANKVRFLNTRHSDFYLRRRKVQVLHETYYRPARQAVGHIPVVVTVHDLIHEIFPEEFSPNDPTALHRRLSVDRADHVICVSAGTQRDLVERLAIPIEKTSVIYHGITRFSPAAPPIEGPKPLAAGAPYLLHVGNRRGYKNFDNLLRAYASSARLRATVRLVAFGGGPPTPAELDLLRRSALSSGDDLAGVSFVRGDDARLSSHLLGAMALVYPSRYEGFGMPPLEAMAAGCPVICSRASVMPEVLGSAPHYFEPGDVDDIRRALEEVVFSSTLRASLVSAGHDRAGRYSWRRCAEESLAVYRGLLRR